MQSAQNDYRNQLGFLIEQRAVPKGVQKSDTPDDLGKLEATPPTIRAGTKEKGQSIAWPRKSGGPKEDRTPDLRIANAALSQLSYRPTNACILLRNAAGRKSSMVTKQLLADGGR